MPRLPGAARALPALALLLLSCVADSSSPVGPEPEPQGTPVAVSAVSGAGQTGPAGGALGAPLVVRVADAAGRGVRGVAVGWEVSPGGGTLSAASTPTDSAGEARAQWTLGTAAGAHTATASVAGLPAATFAATAVLPQPARLEAAGGDGQTADAGAPLADSLAVKVSYADGRPAPGVVVAWAATGGGGALGPASAATGADGVAKARWTLGAAGANTAEAAVAGLAGSPVVFRATGRAAGGPALARVSGDGQSATAGSALPAALVVRVADAGGSPVAGASVTWRVASGGGSVAPAISTTDAEGLARAAWTLGTTAGTNSVSAAAAGATVGFTATGTAGPAAGVARVAGDGQSAPTGSALPAPLVVRVADAHGNPVAGAAVGWAATAGGGTLSPASAATNGEGQASAAWTMGAAAGANAAAATVAGAGSATFSATATTRAAPTLVRTMGDGQTGAAGTTLELPLRVRLTDAEGRPVQGTPVAWTVTAGGGSVSPPAYTTDAGGEALTIWTLGPAPGANAVTATVAGVGSVAFGAQARAGTGTVGAVAKSAGDEQFGRPGSSLSIAPTVRVTDTGGDPLPGVAVSWAVTGGGGSVERLADRTAADGRASAVWTLGPSPGAHTLAATVGGSTLVFTATALAPSGGLARVGGDGQTGHVGTELPRELMARVTDAAGNPLRGHTVTWAVTGGGGSFSFVSSTTLSDGTARAGWIMGRRRARRRRRRAWAGRR